MFELPKIIQRPVRVLAVLPIMTVMLLQTVPAQSNDFGLEEIVVTASKRAESLQDSSLIIDAFSADELEKSGITDVSDIQSLVPGVQVGMGGPALQVYVRGVGNPGSTAVTNPAVAINKGGVYVARSQAAAMSFFDLERIEVLKGPQGTLYGRNATGGALNLIPALPDTEETSGYVSADIGNYDLRKIEAVVNLPINDELAVRGSVLSLERDGYLSDGTDDEDRLSVRLQTLWEPSDKFSVLVAGQYAKAEGKGHGYSFAGAADPWDSIVPNGNGILMAGAQANGLIAPITVLPPWITGPVVGVIPAGPLAGTPLVSLVDPIVDDTFQDLEFYDVSATLEWELDFATLTLIPAYQKAEMHYVSHPGLRYETFNPLTDEGESSEVTSLEARLSNESDKLKWVAGVFVYDESQKANVRIDQGLAQNIAIIADYQNDSLGVFGEINYSLTDTSRLIAGLRYSKDDSEKSNFRRYGFHESLTCPPPAQQMINGLATCLISASADEKVSFDSTDWKIGFEHDINDDSMIFITISTGYKAGGISQVAESAFKPEELTAFELGSRNIFMEGRLQLNADIFYWDYQDHQEFVIGPDAIGIVGQSIINAGDATIKGASIDLKFAATENDVFGFNLEYLDAEYDDFKYTQSAQFTAPNHSCNLSPTGTLVAGNAGAMVPELLIDCSGFQMTRAPDWTGSADYVHTFDLGDNGTIDASIDVNFVDERWISANFLPGQRVDSHTIWNARATYVAANEAFSLTAYIKNISEEASYGSSTVHSQVYQLIGLSVGAPRTYGLRLRYNF